MSLKTWESVFNVSSCPTKKFSKTAHRGLEFFGARHFRYYFSMFRYMYKSKSWEGIPDKEKIVLKKWSKNANNSNDLFIKEVKKSKKNAQRLSFSLEILLNNLDNIKHDFKNSVGHLKSMLHFGASGKLLENYTNNGNIIKRKITLVIGLFYNIPFISTKILRLKSDRKTIKIYRELYGFVQHSEIEIQNSLNPIKCRSLLTKIIELENEILLKIDKSKSRITTIKNLFKISP